ncbi:MAG: YdgA family protein [Halothiobacillaceae bacterium]|nr:YdgA family protein [Halothiobacillaceae bacterium]HER34583.1 DUF945 domain-containing protein [Halothiobacillaceae bacterium]
MKRLIFAVAVVLVAIAAAPLVTGLVMERTLSQVGPFPGTRGTLSLEVTDYQRGYLESHAESALLLRLPEREPLRLTLTHRIDHWPGLDGRYATVHTRWEPADSASRATLAELFGDGADLTLSTALYPTGGSRTTGRVPAIEREGMEFTGADLVLETSTDGGFDYRFETDRFALDDQAVGVDPGTRLTTQGLRLAASGQVADDGFVWDGQGRLSLDRLQVVEADRRSSAEDLSLAFESAREGDLFRFAVDYQAGAATVDDESLTDARLRVAIERLDAEAVRTVIQRLEEIREHAPQTSRAAQRADIEGAVGRVMQEALPALLSRGPRISIDPLKATTPEGDAEMAVSVELPADVIKGEPNPMMWMALVSAMAVEGRLTMPLALLEKQVAAQGDPGRAGDIKAQLAPLVEQGWVTVEDGVVKTTLDFRQGNLELNGTPANQLLNMALGATTGQ